METTYIQRKVIMKIETRNLIILNSLVIVICILIGTFKAFVLPAMGEYLVSRRSKLPKIEKIKQNNLNNKKKIERIEQEPVEYSYNEPTEEYTYIPTKEDIKNQKRLEKQINKRERKKQRLERKQAREQKRLERKLKKVKNLEEAESEG